MSIYSIEYLAEDYRILVPVDKDELDGGILWIDGTAKGASWQPPEMRWSHQESNEAIPDIAYITPGFYAFNEKAMAVLGDLLSDYGELLPLPVADETWTAFNPTTERDCLNKDQSEWKIRRGGQKGRLLKAVFDEDKTDGAMIFQIPELNRSEFFVTDEFVQRVAANQLTGLEFVRNESV